LLRGSGVADLYLEGTGDVSPRTNIGFEYPLREGTINLPATNDAVLAVGATIDRVNWTSVDSVFDEPLWKNAIVDPGDLTSPVPGQDAMLWFSSAGPTVTGTPKPEISAPGGYVGAAMSSQAEPGSIESVFSVTCPAPSAGAAPSPRCMQVDPGHAIAAGTSLAAPMVTGAAAILLQQDRTLTQATITALLEAGTHSFRQGSLYYDQAGVGELDVTGALDALGAMTPRAPRVPTLDSSRIMPGTSHVLADGSQPVTGTLILHSREGVADGFDSSRLMTRVDLDGHFLASPAATRQGPGLWRFTWQATGPLAGHSLSFSAMFDGAPIAATKTVPVVDALAETMPCDDAPAGSCTIGRRRDRTTAAAYLPVIVLGLLSLACLYLRPRAEGRGS
jgi:hypothetical protein